MTPSAGVRGGISLGEMLLLSAQRSPDKDCFLFPDGSAQSFAQTNQRVNRLVDALRAAGIGKGSRLAVFGLDSHRYVEVVLAALKLGAVYVPLNYRLTRSEVDVLLDRAQPVALFHDARYAQLMDGIAQRHPSLRLTITFDPADGAANGYEALLASGLDREPPVVSADSDTIGLAFTSGTTGLPKGVVQSQRMVKNIIYAQIIDYRVLPDDIRYVAAPAFHITGICNLLMGVAYGYTSLIVPQFDPSTTLRFLAENRITATFLVPTMISMLLQQPGVADHSYDRLRLMYYGASAMSPTLLRRAMDTFRCDFINAFGAGTEAGLQAVLRPEEHRRALADEPELLGSIGKPSYGVALRIVDDDMNDLPVGEVGEIATRSDQVMDGYLDMPVETDRALRDGWFRAGDMGYVDKNGYLYLHGRKSDMIIRGGENIYPVEVEAVLAECADVVQAAVIGVPDEHWGETVRAFVTLREGSCATAQDLVEHCANRLTKFKVPGEFRIVGQLPTNASGKVLKRELRTWT